MKIRRVASNNRKAQLELWVSPSRFYPFPYARLRPRPTARNPMREVYVDDELGCEAVTYVLASGAEGSVHLDHALEYNEDPSELSALLIHRLTVEAQRRIDKSRLSRREIARCLKTSVPQLYRLLDPTNTKKGMNQLVALLHVLGCDVELTVRPRNAA